MTIVHYGYAAWLHGGQCMLALAVPKQGQSDVEVGGWRLGTIAKEAGARA